MSGCSAVQARFSEYLDSRLNGREMQLIAAHLEECRDCSREWDGLRQTQVLLAALGPVPEPADLLLRIRVAVSQERARSRRSVFHGWNLLWKNTVGPFLLQAGAGFASAVLLLGSAIVLITMFAHQGRASGQPHCAAAGEFVNRRGRQPDRGAFRPGGGGSLCERTGRDVRLSHCFRAERRGDPFADREYAVDQPF